MMHLINSCSMKVIFESDLCEKFFRPEPMLFMLSRVIFPKQLEGWVSQPKVYKQTQTQTPTVMILWCKKWISDPGIKCGLFLMTPKASVIPDSSIFHMARTQRSASTPTFQSILFLCVLSKHVNIACICVATVVASLTEQDIRLWQSIKTFGKPFSSNTKLGFWGRYEFHSSVNLENKTAVLCKS